MAIYQYIDAGHIGKLSKKQKQPQELRG